MKRLFFLFLAIFLLCLDSLGQGKVELENLGHDFGNIVESDGPVLYQFNFKNIGDKPIRIKDIKASCGCTTPSWSKDSVPPGDNGFFQAKFNPNNRPGAFRKVLTITTDGIPKVTKVYIEGMVEPKPRTIQEKMPIKIGATRLKSRVVNLGRSVNNEIVKSEFSVFNDSNDTLKLLRKYDAPEFITLNFEDSILLPQSEVKIDLIYDTEHDDNLGMQNYGIMLYTDELDYPRKKLDVMITLKEYFPEMTDNEITKSPRLYIAERKKNLGDISQQKTIKAEFTVTNHGKEKLEIRKLESNCSCLTATIDDKTIRSGNSTKIIATFNSEKRRGIQNKSISIYSNDPREPTQIVTIRASVTSKK